jgi:hypothetical protein
MGVLHIVALQLSSSCKWIHSDCRGLIVWSTSRRFVDRQLSPAANFEAFERETELFKLTSDVTHMFSQRRFHCATHSPERELGAASALGCGEQTADFIGQYFRRAEINGTLPAAIAVAERVIGAETTLADNSPRGDDRSLAGEQFAIVGYESLDTLQFLVNKHRLFRFRSRIVIIRSARQNDLRRAADRRSADFLRAGAGKSS